MRTVQAKAKAKGKAKRNGMECNGVEYKMLNIKEKYNDNMIMMPLPELVTNGVLPIPLPIPLPR